MRFHFWEYVFFASAFGTVIFFPYATPLFSFLTQPVTVFVLGLTGISAFAALAIHEKNREKRARLRTLAAALLIGCVALLISFAGRAMPPVFILWSANVVLALFTFGSILARRFFRRVERDFARNIGHVIVIGIATQAVAFFFTLVSTIFPPILIGAAVAVVAYSALL